MWICIFFVCAGEHRERNVTQHSLPTRRSSGLSCSVLLVTGSQYVMKGINEWMANWKKRGWKTAAKEPVKNADLWKQLDEQVNRHNVTWKWVRGHKIGRAHV